MALWGSSDVPFDLRVTRTREALAKAKTERQAMIALSEADTAVLREIEAEYTFHPGPADTLLDRIASAHVQFVTMLASQALHTKLVTPQLVGAWAAETLTEWLPGYTDFRKEWGGQYRIRHIDGGDKECDGELFEVTTAQGFGARRFRIQVKVAAIK